MKSEKRRVQRVMLESPIKGSLSKQGVTLVDLSTAGARVEHTAPIGGRKVVELRFSVDGQQIEIACEVVRSRLQRSAIDGSSIVYSSGLRFSDPGDDSRGTVRALVARLVQGLVPERTPDSVSLSMAV
jgi:hypothetical protein